MVSLRLAGFLVCADGARTVKNTKLSPDETTHTVKHTILF
jgi:hypothetical protein